VVLIYFFFTFYFEYNFGSNVTIIMHWKKVFFSSLTSIFRHSFLRSISILAAYMQTILQQSFHDYTIRRRSKGRPHASMLCVTEFYADVLHPSLDRLILQLYIILFENNISREIYFFSKVEQKHIPYCILYCITILHSILHYHIAFYIAFYIALPYCITILHYHIAFYIALPYWVVWLFYCKLVDNLQ
jgi:hypothetical protein